MLGCPLDILHHCSQIMIAEIQCQVDGVAISIRHAWSNKFWDWRKKAQIMWQAFQVSRNHMHVLGSWGLYHKPTSRKALLPCIMFEQSFAHFKIVGGNLCSSFCEACFRLDFLRTTINITWQCKRHQWTIQLQGNNVLYTNCELKECWNQAGSICISGSICLWVMWVSTSGVLPKRLHAGAYWLEIIRITL